ncbi:MAG: hypothetical protein AB4426_18585 [Xenococcaceae cyanobacterium]
MSELKIQLTTTEINFKKQLLQNYSPALKAIAVLEENNGRLDTSWLPAPTLRSQIFFAIHLSPQPSDRHVMDGRKHLCFLKS